MTRTALPATLQDWVRENEHVGEWEACKDDFPRFAQLVGRELVERTGETFCPYGQFHFELAALALKDDRAVVLAPRDHIKSTVMSQLFPLWLAAYQPDGVSQRILLISDTAKQAKRNLENIKALVVHVPWLAEHLHEEHPTTWTRTEIVLANGSRIEVSGFGSPIRGSHYHLIVMDDIIGDTQRFTFEFMNRFIRRAIIPMVKIGCKLFAVGTPQHDQDPLMVLFDNPRFAGYKYRAVLDWDHQKVLWPERWTFKLLMERRAEIGTTAFAQEYQCEPVDDSSSLFPWSILEQCFATHMQTKRAYDGPHPVYVGVDVAKSAKVGADWWVAVVLEVDEDENRNILAVERARGLGLTEQVARLASTNERYHPEAIVVEANAMAMFLTEATINRTDIPIRPHTTGREKASFEEGVPSLVVRFENKKYRIPRQLERDRHETDPLVNELNHHGWEGATVKGRGAHDDCVMALWLAELAVRSRGRRVRKFVVR